MGTTLFIMFITLAGSHSIHLRKNADVYDPLYGRIGDLIINDENRLASNIEEAIEHGIENDETQGKIANYITVQLNQFFSRF